MKKLAFLITILIVACNPSKNKSEKFFDYDQIDYYINETVGEDNLSSLYDNQNKSVVDSIKFGVILGDIPKSINDLSFIPKLAATGYKHYKIPKSKFAVIDEFFRTKTPSKNITTACIFVYRDILIFKKKGKVVGTAKICFGCMAHEIQGSKVNTDNFGQDGDYERLAKVLSDLE